MGRPVKCRRICELPRIEEFAPVNAEALEEIEMTVDEFETIRLIDYQDYSQEACARQMNVARTTVQAIYDSARQKLAAVLVEGKRLKIGGGAYEVCPEANACCRRRCRQLLYNIDSGKCCQSPCSDNSGRCEKSIEEAEHS